MATLGLSEEVVGLGRDLRTVVALLCGDRLSAEICEELVAEVFAGACTRRHQAVVYLLATHLLALDERPTLDHLAWRWLNARGERSLRVREASDAMRLAVFALESGWSGPLVGRMITLIGMSRATTSWVDLGDLARNGGRNAEALRPLIQRADPWSPSDPSRAGALLVLAAAHELHQITSVAGDDFAAVAHCATDVRCLTLFTATATPSTAALAATGDLLRRTGLQHTIHASPAGVRRLGVPGSGRVVAMGPVPEELFESAARPLATRGQASANLPSLLAVPPADVLGVFPSGPRLVRDARWWAAGRRPRQAR